MSSVSSHRAERHPRVRFLEDETSVPSDFSEGPSSSPESAKLWPPLPGSVFDRWYPEDFYRVKDAAASADPEKPSAFLKAGHSQHVGGGGRRRSYTPPSERELARFYSDGDSQTEFAKLMNRIKNLESMITDLQKANAELKATDSTKKNEIISRKIDEVSRLKRERDLSRDKHAETENKLEETKGKFLAVKSLYTEQNRRIDSLLKEIKKLEDRITQLQEQQTAGSSLCGRCCVIL